MNLIKNRSGILLQNQYKKRISISLNKGMDLMGDETNNFDEVARRSVTFDLSPDK